MNNNVILSVEDGIAIVTLNRPEVGNAMNRLLLGELHDCLRQVGQDEQISVLVITGAGRMFCSGMDLRGLSTPEDTFEETRMTMETFDLIHNLPQPTIAAVNGYAVTGGMELILACDLRIAADTAMFADTHARVGILPGGGDSQKLPRLIGLARAKEMLFTCDFLSAQEAAQFGLVNRVVPAAQLLDEARAMAKKIQANNQWILRRIKKIMNDGWSLDLQSAMLLERSECQGFLLSSQLQELARQRAGMLDRNRASAAERDGHS